jgi:hypothetical protein
VSPATHADRIAAAASIHGGRLVTEHASSPHRLVGIELFRDALPPVAS